MQQGGGASLKLNHNTRPVSIIHGFRVADTFQGGQSESSYEFHEENVQQLTVADEGDLFVVAGIAQTAAAAATATAAVVSTRWQCVTRTPQGDRGSWHGDFFFFFFFFFFCLPFFFFSFVFGLSVGRETRVMGVHLSAGI